MKNKKLSFQQTQRMQKTAQSQKNYQNNDQILRMQVIAHHGRHFSAVDLQCCEKIYKIEHSRRFYPVVGDEIDVLCDSSGSFKVNKICPRKTELKRLEEKHERILASNIDQAFVVLAKKPDPWPELLAQYHTYLSLLKIKPIFLINKADLGDLHPDLTTRLAYYQKHLDLNVVFCSSRAEESLICLKGFMKHRSSIFIGPSGVGKSSLIQALLPKENLVVGDLSESGKGGHTTSVTRLYRCDDFCVIDSPGIRQCDLGPLTVAQLRGVFSDLKQYGCRFQDCDHRHSHGCGLPAVLNQPDLAQRYHDYCFLWDKFIAVRL